MKTVIEHGNLVVYLTPLVYIHTVNKWQGATIKDFAVDIISVYFDRDSGLDRLDFAVVVLGFGLSLKVNYFEPLTPEEKKTMWGKIKEKIGI
jgi:hypothetical protein